jgi:hypothetical protein
MLNNSVFVDTRQYVIIQILSLGMLKLRAVESNMTTGVQNLFCTINFVLLSRSQVANEKREIYL